MLPAKREEIYTLFRDGKSYTEIAVTLRLNRNQIASEIRRGRDRGIDLPKRSVKDYGDTVAMNVYRSVKPIKREKLPETLEGVAMLDVGESQCREIIGHLRCCGKPIERISYCAEHARRNYIGG